MPVRGATQFTGSGGDQLAANEKQSVTFFLRRALPPGRQFRRPPCFLFGLGTPGARLYLSARIISSVWSPVFPVRRDQALGDPSGDPLWAPVIRFGPVSDFWGLAPLGPRDHRRASPTPGGPGDRVRPSATRASSRR
ncbi:hypothetical protein NDU88_006635 [Pleurodeles waltl]|uniref:Uncharacterized protein n=1 Tax=Pleurodeles waltl TaxID=8319 RepID=A0AAV7TXS5_PLEWA|nr:hypothetical protein NDU88_006635 [Pleurodeles waltl]